MRSINQSQTDLEKTQSPLITLAILTYNQADFIEAAILGALSQTYQHLEIIISDDCSSDKTYEVAARTINANTNIRAARLIKNNKNLGLLAHINKLISEANGEIVVLAAGDDISHPDRCQKIAAAFEQNSNVHAIHTAYTLVTEENGKIQSSSTEVQKCIPSDLELLYNGGGVGLGATYAYRKKCFTWPKPLPEHLINEDRILPWRAHLLGGVLFLDESLVSYRLTSKGLSRDSTLPRWPARKNKEHLKNLVHETVLAYELGALKEKDLTLYKRLLGELFQHMDMLDLIRRRAGTIGHLTATVFGGLFLQKYKFLKKLG